MYLSLQTLQTDVLAFCIDSSSKSPENLEIFHERHNCLIRQTDRLFLHRFNGKTKNCQKIVDI